MNKLKINEPGRIHSINQYQKKNDMAVNNANKKQKKDEVQISAAAKEMLSTSQTNGPERAKQIESLKQSITSGTYHVDSGKLAEKLLPYFSNNPSE
ncbi:flagellar biosynthesis anti-sigma factor FlgM [Paenibacillus sp. FSL H8-0537]|uniref:flagellar biosynthesis anti-sigma factor FlgM n=1 Tax=Paenibacillus sp. FSL H8-0537 TaxID=2921399 RepID=UPI0031010CC2